ncbi:hypothetical protein BBJ28_00000772 [Nothophytophthora sp. Chile5]|nr:hypothetical protein BBJ28_00000772 [Nothophytophthora sp. Chile5]
MSALLLARSRGLRCCWSRKPPALGLRTSRSFASGVPRDNSERKTNAAVRVRYAPSPTGYLHLGGLRTALFNYLFAKSSGGQFLLRIEDTDKRLQKLRESQARHGEATMYDRACLGLEDKEVEARVARGEPHTIRLKIPEGKTVVKDLLRGYVQFEHAGIDDQVLMKSDGYPTYHLANVVDDHAMHISHVIRGEEWLPSTPKHVILYKALGFEAPTFSIDHVNKAGSVVNVERLRWINSRHVRALFAEETATYEHKQTVVNDVLPMIASALEEVGLPSAPNDVVNQFGLDYVWRAMDLMKERVSALPEFGPLCVPFFAAPDLSFAVAQDMKAKYIDESTPDLVNDVRSVLRDLSDEDFKPDVITKSIKAVAKSRKLGLKK